MRYNLKVIRYILLLMLLNFSCTPFKQINDSGNSELNFNGLYYVKTAFLTTDYFRLYPDSTVAFVISTGNINQVSEWFTRNDTANVGKYNIFKKDSLTFYLIIPSSKDTIFGKGKIYSKKEVEISLYNPRAPVPKEENRIYRFKKIKLID